MKNLLAKFKFGKANLRFSYDEPCGFYTLGLGSLRMDYDTKLFTSILYFCMLLIPVRSYGTGQGMLKLEGLCTFLGVAL